MGYPLPLPLTLRRPMTTSRNRDVRFDWRTDEILQMAPEKFIRPTKSYPVYLNMRRKTYFPFTGYPRTAFPVVKNPLKMIKSVE